MVVVNWIIAHQAICAALLVGIIDLIYALAPSVQSNGILHMIYLQLKGVLSSQPPAPPAQ